jgi:hypothetical protein
MKILNPEGIRVCGGMFRWTFKNCVKLIQGGGDKQGQEKGYKWSFL